MESKKTRSPLEKLEARINLAKKELHQTEMNILRFHGGQVPSPPPEDYTYWKGYLAGLEYAHSVFKTDDYQQMYLLK